MKLIFCSNVKERLFSLKIMVQIYFKRKIYDSFLEVNKHGVQ